MGPGLRGGDSLAPVMPVQTGIQGRGHDIDNMAASAETHGPRLRGGDSLAPVMPVQTGIQGRGLDIDNVAASAETDGPPP
ncbi:hypothetical protein B6S09_07000 [Oceanimonas baumannii]|uniref:Uncharacterized protein n=1 Tax=Oceanimonas baumannii TaxID=129578 RepID=A0A235CKR1_9GAMM|nr:hypothetical protein B6S09_07000 [Oceanimonas baumannii]